MRVRAAAISAVVVLLGVAPLAHAEQPRARLSFMQFAYASWLVTEGERTVLYFAAGLNQVPSTTPSMGFVGKARCTLIAHGHHSRWHCRGHSAPSPLSPGDFTVDPLLSSARLTLAQGGFTHEVSWTGRSAPPRPMWHQHAGNDVKEVFFMTWMRRRAAATGSIFGQDLLATRRALIGENAEAAVSTDYGPVDVDFGPAEIRDGLLVVNENYRVQI